MDVTTATESTAVISRDELKSSSSSTAVRSTTHKSSVVETRVEFDERGETGLHSQESQSRRSFKVESPPHRRWRIRRKSMSYSDPSNPPNRTKWLTFSVAQHTHFIEPTKDDPLIRVLSSRRHPIPPPPLLLPVQSADAECGRANQNSQGCSSKDILDRRDGGTGQPVLRESRTDSTETTERNNKTLANSSSNKNDSLNSNSNQKQSVSTVCSLPQSSNNNDRTDISLDKNPNSHHLTQAQYKFQQERESVLYERRINHNHNPLQYQPRESQQNPIGQPTQQFPHQIQPNNRSGSNLYKTDRIASRNLRSVSLSARSAMDWQRQLQPHQDHQYQKFQQYHYLPHHQSLRSTTSKIETSAICSTSTPSAPTLTNTSSTACTAANPLDLQSPAIWNNDDGSLSKQDLNGLNIAGVAVTLLTTVYTLFHPMYIVESMMVKQRGQPLSYASSTTSTTPALSNALNAAEHVGNTSMTPNQRQMEESGEVVTATRIVAAFLSELKEEDEFQWQDQSRHHPLHSLDSSTATPPTPTATSSQKIFVYCVLVPSVVVVMSWFIDVWLSNSTNYHHHQKQQRRRIDLIRYAGYFYAFCFIIPFAWPGWLWIPPTLSSSSGYLLSTSLFDISYAFITIVLGAAFIDCNNLTMRNRIAFMSSSEVMYLLVSIITCQFGLPHFMHFVSYTENIEAPRPTNDTENTVRILMDMVHNKSENSHHVFVQSNTSESRAEGIRDHESFEQQSQHQFYNNNDLDNNSNPLQGFRRFLIVVQLVAVLLLVIAQRFFLASNSITVDNKQYERRSRLHHHPSDLNLVGNVDNLNNTNNGSDEEFYDGVPNEDIDDENSVCSKHTKSNDNSHGYCSSNGNNNISSNNTNNNNARVINSLFSSFLVGLSILHKTGRILLQYLSLFVPDTTGDILRQHASQARLVLLDLWQQKNFRLWILMESLSKAQTSFLSYFLYLLLGKLLVATATATITSDQSLSSKYIFHHNLASTTTFSNFGTIFIVLISKQIATIFAYVPIAMFGYYRVYKHVVELSLFLSVVAFFVVSPTSSEYMIVGYLFIYTTILRSFQSASIYLVLHDIVTEFRHKHLVVDEQKHLHHQQQYHQQQQQLHHRWLICFNSSNQEAPPSWAAFILGINSFFVKPTRIIFAVFAERLVSATSLYNISYPHNTDIGDDGLDDMEEKIKQQQRVTLFRYVVVVTIFCSCLQMWTWKRYELKPRKVAKLRDEIKMMLMEQREHREQQQGQFKSQPQQQHQQHHYYQNNYPNYLQQSQLNNRRNTTELPMFITRHPMADVNDNDNP